jgi:hypothetical protein
MADCTLTENDPVTDIAIVSKKDGCPHGYSLVSQTVGGLNADLADKKMFTKGHRYLVVTREFPLPIGNYVVKDLQLFHEGSPAPLGYEILSHTRNDGLLALRKVNFCLKRAHREHLVSCICDVILVNLRKKEKLPDHYVGIGEVNGLTVGVQFGGIPGALQKVSPRPQRASSTSQESSSVLKHPPQTHGETTEGPEELQFSLFRPYFYLRTPPTLNEDIARAQEMRKKGLEGKEEVAAARPVPDEMLLFSRFTDGRAHPGSIPETQDEGNEMKPQRKDSFTSSYHSLRPISVVPLTGV